MLIKCDEDAASKHPLSATSISMTIKLCMKAVFDRCASHGDLHKLGHSMIYARKLKHPHGLVLVYFNDSADKQLHEVMEVEIRGAYEIEH